MTDARVVRLDDLEALKEAIHDCRAIAEVIEGRGVALKKQGKELYGRCPFHDDAAPSFRVNPGEGDGVWNCSPCGEGGDVIKFVMRRDGITFPEAVRKLAAELGVTARAPDDAAPPDAEMQVVATYRYTDAAGKPLGVKERLEHVPRRGNQKRMMWRHADGALGRPSPWVPTLYRMREVAEAIACDIPIVVVEGEKCADKIDSEYGLIGTTNEDGAGKWLPEHAELLRGARVVVLPDNDKAGREHAEVVAKSLLGIARTVAIGTLPGFADLPSKADIVDWFAAGHTPLELTEAVDAALWDGELTRAKIDLQMVGAGERAGRVRRPMLQSALSLWDEPDEEVRDLVEGLVPERGLTVQSSDPKTGKTWIEQEIAVSIATGTKVFGRFATGAPRHVAMFLFEDKKSSTKNRLRAIAAGKGMPKERALARVQLVCKPSFNLVNVDDLAWVVASVRLMPEAPAAIFLDPLRDAWVGNETDEMDTVTRALRQLVKVLDCAVFVTHHNRKAQNAGGKDRGQAGDEMRGGGELRGRIDAGLYPKKKGGDGKNTFELDVRTENRDGQGAGSFGLSFHIIDEDRRAVDIRWQVIEPGAPGISGDESRIIAALVRLNEARPNGWFGVEQIRETAGMNKDNCRAALDSLRGKKKVEKSIGNLGWRLFSGELDLPGPGPAIGPGGSREKDE